MHFSGEAETGSLAKIKIIFSGQRSIRERLLSFICSLKDIFSHIVKESSNLEGWLLNNAFNFPE